MVDEAPKGWVPAGCLLETNIPPAVAISEAKGAISSPRTARSSPNWSPPVAHKSPILPSKIISTSFPGIALMNYSGKGEHELSLTRGDVLRVFKRYNHWSYVRLESCGVVLWTDLNPHRLYEKSRVTEAGCRVGLSANTHQERRLLHLALFLRRHLVTTSRNRRLKRPKQEIALSMDILYWVVLL